MFQYTLDLAPVGIFAMLWIDRDELSILMAVSRDEGTVDDCGNPLRHLGFGRGDSFVCRKDHAAPLGIHARLLWWKIFAVGTRNALLRGLPTSLFSAAGIARAGGAGCATTVPART